MADKLTLLDSITNRRTYYALNKDLPISDSRVEELVTFAIKHVPSSFNSQSARLVVLLKAEHDKFWDAVLEILKPMVPPEQFGHTEQRIGGFKAGYGTVRPIQAQLDHSVRGKLTQTKQILFYEDPDDIHRLQKQFAIYADKFPQWSEHTSAMHQYALWLALEAEGCGANLQHYNPVIDQKAANEWNVPQEWQLKAQLVFGGRAAEPGEKQFKPIEGERLFVHGK